MTSWRPSGWDAQQIAEEAGEIGNDEQRGLIEAGASVMLEALRKDYPQTHISEIEIKGGEVLHGKWVFIPDDPQ